MQQRWVSAKGDSRMRGEREWINFLYILRDFDSGVRSEKSVEIETQNFQVTSCMISTRMQYCTENVEEIKCTVGTDFA